MKKIVKFLYRSITNKWSSNPYFTGLDVTYRCNLDCALCYYKTQAQTTELSDNQMKQFITTLYQQGIVGCTLLGGEPLLRREIVQHACMTFPFTMLFTNGTIPLDQIKPSLIAISIDGTPEIHNELRGAGVFQKIADNLMYSSIQSPVFVHTTLSRALIGKEKSLCDALLDLPNVDHVIFSMVNHPTEGQDTTYQLYSLSIEERKQMVYNLLQLRKQSIKYRKFILLTHKLGQHLIPGTREKKTWSSPETCHFFKSYVCYDSMGNYKSQCPFGDQTYCQTCGCAAGLLYHASHGFHIPSFSLVTGYLLRALFQQYGILHSKNKRKIKHA